MPAPSVNSLDADFLTVTADNNKFLADWSTFAMPTVNNSVITSVELIVNDTRTGPDLINGYKSYVMGEQALLDKSITITGLTNGVEYNVRLIVNYTNNKIYKSDKVLVKPQSKSPAPIISCVGVNGGINITVNYSQSADASNGFAVVSQYEVFYNDEVQFCVPSTMLALNGLTNDNNYEIAVRAINTNGVSDFSLTNNCAPSPLPANVTNFAAVAKDASIDLSWDKPASGWSDSSVYKIEYKIAGGSYAMVGGDLSAKRNMTTTESDAAVDTATANAGAALSSTAEAAVRAVQFDRLAHTITGLTNGSTYYFRIRAYNGSLTSEYNNAISSVPFGAPSPPTLISAVVSDGQVVITIKKPDNFNGKSITDLILKRATTGGGETDISLGTANITGERSATITGLTNGVQVTFNAYAKNDTNSVSALNSFNATPYKNPGSVTGLSGVGGNNSVNLSWSVPSDNGGYTSLLYKINYNYLSNSVSTAATEISTSELSKYVSANLANGVSTTFSVVAYFSANGTTYNSAPAEFPCVPFKVPDAPSISASMNASDKIAYSWSQPNLYNLSLSKYKYKMQLESVAATESGLAAALAAAIAVSPLEITPAVYGVEYRLTTQTATILNGADVVGSTLINNFTPYKKPSIVQNLAVYPKQNALDLEWSAPSDLGGYTDIKYKIVVDNTASAPITNRYATISSLIEAKSYNISVIAQGYLYGVLKHESAPSVVEGIPYVNPTAPASFVAQPNNNRSITLNWSEVTMNDGGAVVYNIFRDDSQIASNLTALTLIDTGLVAGRQPTYAIRAKRTWANNYVSYSDPVVALPKTVYEPPSKVLNLLATSADKRIQISWDALDATRQGGLNSTSTPAPTVMYNVVITHAGAAGAAAVTDLNETSNSNAIDLTNTFKDATATSPAINIVNGVTYTIVVKPIIYNADISADVNGATETTTIMPNDKPAVPVDVVVTPIDGKIKVEWFAPALETGYLNPYYEIYFNDVLKATSDLSSASVTKNKVEIVQSNGLSTNVKICRFVTNASNVLLKSDSGVNTTVTPFGKPIVNSASINSNNRKQVKLNISPNGSQILNIIVFAVTDKYTSGDESYKALTNSSLDAANKDVITDSINETVTFILADGTLITSFFWLVVNAAGATVATVATGTVNTVA